MSIWIQNIKKKFKSGKKMRMQENSTQKVVKPVFEITIFVIIMIGQLIYWGAFFPGGFNLDAYGQWDQVHGLMKLNNWHPVFTTLCYWVITRIWDNFAFCIFVQLFIFSVSVTVLFYQLYIVNVPKIIIIVIAFCIAINPGISMNNVCLYKDVPFTIVVIWLCIVTIKIYLTKGDWLKQQRNCLLLWILLLAMMLIRHNGIFFVIPFLLTIFFVYSKAMKQGIILAVCLVVSILIIEEPVFQATGVEKHDNVVGEMVGIPMAILANSYVNDYENTPNDVKEYLESIADRSEWQSRYIIGEWDSCKWEFGGIDLLKGEKLNDILRMTKETIINSPKTSFQAFKEATRVVWQVVGKANWNTWVYIEDNDYGIQSNHLGVCEAIVNFILKGSNTLVGTTFCWNIGTVVVTYLLVGIYTIKKRLWERLCFLIPSLVYDLCTALLLCGSSHRYFYFNGVLVLPVIAVIFCIVKKSTVSNERKV